MKILISGICGFVGSTLVAGLQEADLSLAISVLDNFIRTGSETNRLQLPAFGIPVWHAEVRSEPSVIAGVDGRSDPPPRYCADQDFASSTPSASILDEVDSDAKCPSIGSRFGNHQILGDMPLNNPSLQLQPLTRGKYFSSGDYKKS